MLSTGTHAYTGVHDYDVLFTFTFGMVQSSFAKIRTPCRKSLTYFF